MRIEDLFNKNFAVLEGWFMFTKELLEDNISSFCAMFCGLWSWEAYKYQQSNLLTRFSQFRSSRPEVFYKKGVLRNFANFTGKHLRQALFFNKIAGLRPATLLKKRPWHWCFPVNFAKLNTFSYRPPPVAASVSCQK